MNLARERRNLKRHGENLSSATATVMTIWQSRVTWQSQCIQIWRESVSISPRIDIASFRRLGANDSILIGHSAQIIHSYPLTHLHNMSRTPVKRSTTAAAFHVQSARPALKRSRVSADANHPITVDDDPIETLTPPTFTAPLAPSISAEASNVHSNVVTKTSTVGGAAVTSASVAVQSKSCDISHEMYNNLERRKEQVSCSLCRRVPHLVAFRLRCCAVHHQPAHVPEKYICIHCLHNGLLLGVGEMEIGPHRTLRYRCRGLFCSECRPDHAIRNCSCPDCQVVCKVSEMFEVPSSLYFSLLQSVEDDMKLYHSLCPERASLRLSDQFLKESSLKQVTIDCRCGKQIMITDSTEARTLLLEHYLHGCSAVKIKLRCTECKTRKLTAAALKLHQDSHRLNRLVSELDRRISFQTGQFTSLDKYKALVEKGLTAITADGDLDEFEKEYEATNAVAAAAASESQSSASQYNVAPDSLSFPLAQSH